MKPLSESRFLQSFLAIAASVVLVCGALILLTSTSPWTSREEAATPAPAAASANTPKTNAPSEPGMSQPPEATAKTEEDMRVAQAEPTSSGGDQPVASELTASETASPVAASDMPQLPTLEGADTEAIDAESMVASDAAARPAEPAVQTGALPDTGEGSEPEMAIAAKPTTVATDETGASLKESQPPAIAARTVSEDPGAVSDHALPTPAASQDKASGKSQTASAEITASVPLPPPPLPKRKPKEPLTSAEIAHAAPQLPRPSRSEASKPDQARPAVAQRAPAQPSSGRWLPMALAPADKPLPAQPIRLSGAAYASKVWAALARHKPRAGQNGSATVVFSIGAGGGLDGVTIGTSSGNARIDQLALATVRGAAPFPLPPSGVASFSIRINFQ
jgi:periplasmic protein TonB